MNAAAFPSELTAVAFHGSVFAGLSLAAWLLCGKQSAARTSACGRLIIAATLVVMFVGFGVAWQRCRTPAEVMPATPAVTKMVSLPDAAAGGESLAILTPQPDDSAMIPAPRKTDSSNAPDTTVQWQLRPGMPPLLVILWAAGAVAIALRWAIALLLRRRFIRGTEVVEDQAWQCLLASLACGMKPVRLLRHGGGAIPCAWGIFRPVILLPQDADRWPGTQRRMVLSHECAHLRRHDPLWQAAGEVFLALQWFNPFAWLILRRCRMADERAADDTVLQTETDAPAYAELLVTCARQWSAKRGLATVTSGMAKPSTICRRVECVLDPAADRRPAGFFMATLWTALCTLLAAGVPLLSPRMTVAQEADDGELVESKPSPANVQAGPADPPPSTAPAPAAAPEEADPPKAPNDKPQSKWNPAKLGGIEYIPANDVARFYEFPKQKTDGDGNLWLRSAKLVVRWRKDSNEMLINNVRFLLKHPVIEHEGSLWISRYDLAGLLHPVLNPSHIKHRPQVSTVVLDAGHGGVDSGAINRHGKESDFTLDTAQRLKRKLEALGYRVVMTRSDDRFLSRPDRVAIANAEANAILISLHFNSFTADRSGIQTFFPGEAMADRGASADEHDTWTSASVALATAVHANVLYKLRAPDGGLKSNEVLDGIRLPMAMIEGGFLSHAGEGARIATPEYRELLADAVAGGVRNFVRAMAAGRRINGSAPVPPQPVEIAPPK